MAAHAEELQRLGAEVVIVGPGTEARAARLRQRLGVSLPILADPAGAGLDALGLTRVMGPFRSSGTVVVDRAGKVRYALRVANPSAALRLPAVVQALTEASA